MGNGGGPAWLAILLAAEAWGTPPWSVLGKEPTPGERLTWLLRYSRYSAARAAKDAADLAGLRK